MGSAINSRNSSVVNRNRLGHNAWIALRLLFLVVMLPLLPVVFLWYVNVIGLYYLLIAMAGQQRVRGTSTKRAVSTSWSRSIKMWGIADNKNLIRIPVSWED